MTTSTKGNKALRAAAIVPGLPHILKPSENPSYEALGRAVGELGDSFMEKGVERVVYYSTQWISVLGHLFQARESLVGYHVDENWHEIADLPFDFAIDVPFARVMAAEAANEGYQTKLVDYEGFPVDTGSIVADTLLNKGRFKTGMLSCCVYSDFADTVKLTGTLVRAIEASGVPTAVVCVTGLSGRFFTTEIDLREDHVSDPKDDEWNKRMLELLAEGRHADFEALIPEYAGACKVDMGFKAYAVLKGLGLAAAGAKGRQRAYGALYGTGAAVVEF